MKAKIPIRRDALKLFLRYARSYLLWFMALVFLAVVQECVQLFRLIREMQNIADLGIRAVLYAGRVPAFIAPGALCGAMIT